MQPSNTPPTNTAATDSNAPPAAGSALVLPASLDLTWADSLHGELQARIGHDQPLTIDGRDVERVSTPCVQLLVAAAISARAHGLGFGIVTPSASLANAVRDLGLERALGMGVA